MIKNEKLKVFNVLIWLASVASMIGLMILGEKFLEQYRYGLLIEFLIITAVTLLYLYLISGRKTFTFFGNRTGYTVGSLFITLLFPIVFMLFGVLTYFMERPAPRENWPLNVLLLAVNMFLVGIYEEGCFRACACDALLPVFRKCRHPFLLTALISGLLFGYVHVVNVDFSDLQQVLQFFLKIATVLLSGTTYMIVYWKTRNLIGLAIAHGLNDFLPEFLYAIFAWQTEETGSYISGNAGTTVIYVIQLVFDLICLLVVYRRVGKTIDYRKTLEEW